MRIAILGDSILCNLNLRGARNFCVPGAKIRDVLNNQVVQVEKYNPELIILHVGTNDINEYNQGLNQEYLDLLTALGKYQTWICLVPKCKWANILNNDQRDSIRISFNKYLKGFSQIKVELPEMESDDGVHYNLNGLDKVKTLLVQKINKLQFKDFYLKDNLKGYEIGDYSYGNPRVVDWHDGATLRVGKFCSIATDVTILLSGEHHYDWVSTYPFMCNPDFSEEVDDVFDLESGIAKYIRNKGNVEIGNDVWIGWGATILSGVKIGDGAIIGAKALVTKDVEPYSIVGGVPAKLINKRFGDKKINELLEIKWWNWDIEKIKASISYLSSP